jgi:hypothetical protein
LGIDHLNGNNYSQARVWSDEKKEEDYFRKLNISGTKSDYLVITQMDFQQDLFKNLKKVERTRFLTDLTNSKLGYRLLNKISRGNLACFNHIITYMPEYIMVFKHE